MLSIPLESLYNESHPNKLKMIAFKESVLVVTHDAKPMLPTSVSGC